MEKSTSTKLAAVIVETRDLPDLVAVIDAHLRHLPGWALHVVGGIATEQTVKRNFPQATFHNTFGSGHPSAEDYNRLLTSETFWLALIGYERVLVFQHDSRLLRAGVEDFLEYDYVGAPWSWQRTGGNGGLSLRNPRTMASLCAQLAYDPRKHGNEDVFFSNNLALVGGWLAPCSVGARFSVEGVFALGTVGYHAIEKYLTPEQCEKIKTQYP